MFAAPVAYDQITTNGSDLATCTGRGQCYVREDSLSVPVPGAAKAPLASGAPPALGFTMLPMGAVKTSSIGSDDRALKTGFDERAASDDGRSTDMASPSSCRRMSWADISDEASDDDFFLNVAEQDNQDAKPEVLELGTEACPTQGSVGHFRGSCASPCKFAWRSRGCKEGTSCARCHLCRFTRAAHRQGKA